MTQNQEFETLKNPFLTPFVRLLRQLAVCYIELLCYGIKSFIRLEFCKVNSFHIKKSVHSLDGLFLWTFCNDIIDLSI